MAAGPYSNTSCFLVRANSVPSPSPSRPGRVSPFYVLSLSLLSPTLLVHGVVIAGGVIALARDLSNNLLCTIPPRHTPPPRLPRRLPRLALGVDLLFFSSISLPISLTPPLPCARALSLSSPFFFCQGNRGSRALGRKIRKIEWILIRERDYPY